MSEFEYRGNRFCIVRTAKSVNIVTHDFAATLGELRALQYYKPNSQFVGGVVVDGRIERVIKNGVDPDSLEVEEDERRCLTNQEMARIEGANLATINRKIDDILARNSGIAGVRLTLEQIMTKAEKYGLLHEMSCVGLQSLGKRPSKK